MNLDFLKKISAIFIFLSVTDLFLLVFPDFVPGRFALFVDNATTIFLAGSLINLINLIKVADR